MKFEIDLNDRSELLRARGELTRFLSIVEYALKEMDAKRSNGNGHQNLLVLSPCHHIGITDTYKPIMSIVDALPKRFTTSSVIVALGDKGKENRSQVKAALKQAVKAGKLTLAEKGVGRRPSTFEKSEN